MKKSIPKIKSVKFKSGGEIRFMPLMPQGSHNISRVDLGWGEVVYRAYDGKRLTLADCYYMADESKRVMQDQ